MHMRQFMSLFRTKNLIRICFVPLIHVLNEKSELKMPSRVILILFCGWACISQILQQIFGENNLFRIFFVPLIHVFIDIIEPKMPSRVILILLCGWSCIVEILQQIFGEKIFFFPINSCLK